MKGDPEQMLDRAAAALREQTGAPAASEQVAATRARILRSHAELARPPRTRATVWLAAAAAAFVVLGGSTAWALWTGRVDEWLAPRPTPTASPPSSVALPLPPTTPLPMPLPEPAPLPDPGPAPDTSGAPALAPEAPDGPTSAVAAGEPVGASIGASSAPSSSLVEHDEVDPRERAAYRVAHRLHFEEHDASGALEAWDRYLATYPRGRFALEASYNRALCLVRLGRTAEARAALAPFAEGTHGGYRRHEASELLDALDER